MKIEVDLHIDCCDEKDSEDVLEDWLGDTAAITVDSWRRIS